MARAESEAVHTLAQLRSPLRLGRASLVPAGQRADPYGELTKSITVWKLENCSTSAISVAQANPMIQVVPIFSVH
jgi:hypothetical protein